MIDIEKFICSLFEVKLTPEQRKHIEDSLRYVDAPYKFLMFKVINSLKEQGLEYKDGKIVEIEPEVYEITKAGKWYVCTIEIANSNNRTAFREGDVLYCPKDGYLSTGEVLFEVGNFSKYFRIASENEIPEKTLYTPEQ